MRFTLSTLFFAVTLLAVGFASMARWGYWWASGSAALAQVLFLGALIRSFAIHGRRKVFALTFSLVGGSYLLVMTTNVSEVIRDALLTNDALAAIRAAATGGWAGFSMIRWDSTAYLHFGLGAFFLIGHSVCAIILALAAGWFAGVVHEIGQRNPSAISMRFTWRLAIALGLTVIAIWSMRTPYGWCGNTVITLTVLLYLTTAILSIGVHGRDRAFAIAFSVTGSLYLAPITINELRPTLRFFPTNQALKAGWMFIPEHWFAPNRQRSSAVFDYFAVSGTTSYDGPGAFFLVGHCAFSWLCALLAAWVAATMYVRLHRNAKLIKP